MRFRRVATIRKDYERAAQHGRLTEEQAMNWLRRRSTATILEIATL